MLQLKTTFSSLVIMGGNISWCWNYNEDSYVKKNKIKSVNFHLNLSTETDQLIGFFFFRQCKCTEDKMSLLTNVFPPTSQVKAWERKDLPCLTARCHLYKVRSEGVKGIISCVAAEAALLSATCYLLPLITVRWLVMVGVSTSLTWLSLVLSHTACRSYSQGEKWSRFYQ